MFETAKLMFNLLIIKTCCFHCFSTLTLIVVYFTPTYIYSLLYKEVKVVEGKKLHQTFSIQFWDTFDVHCSRTVVYTRSYFADIPLSCYTGCYRLLISYMFNCLELLCFDGCSGCWVVVIMGEFVTRTSVLG